MTELMQFWALFRQVTQAQANDGNSLTKSNDDVPDTPVIQSSSKVKLGDSHSSKILLLVCVRPSGFGLLLQDLCAGTAMEINGNDV